MTVDVVTVGAQTPYDVVVGRDLFGRLPDILGVTTTRVLVLFPTPLATYGDRVADILRARGVEVTIAEVPDAEQQKTAEVLAFCWQVLGHAGFTRSDAVVAVGGGATTDLGGFVAASWLRGIRVVHVSTSLLGMVDAAVGGKTGINTPLGKNLVGAFHTPAAVLADLDTLATLPQRDLTAGLAEVIKTGFISDPVILDLVAEHGAALLNHEHPYLRDLVMRSVAVKAAVVAEDLTEQGAREFLNYGHTLGHAIEQHEHFRLRHGEAVAIGMVFAAELGARAGISPATLPETTRRLLDSVGLPTSYHGRWDDLTDALRRDKKTRGHTLRFIVLASIGQPTRYVAPDDALLHDAFMAIGGTVA